MLFFELFIENYNDDLLSLLYKFFGFVIFINK